MFDLDASKIVIVGVAALIFIPPKDLPRVMRQVGQFVGKMKRMANEFQGQFMDAMREADMADLRNEANKLSDAVRVDTGLPSVHDLGREMQPLSIRNQVKAEPLAAPGSVPSGSQPVGDATPVAPSGSAVTAGPAAPSARVEPASEPQHTT